MFGVSLRQRVLFAFLRVIQHKGKESQLVVSGNCSQEGKPLDFRLLGTFWCVCLMG